MKYMIIILIIAANFLSSCAEDETSSPHGEKITPERIAGSWLVISEKRSSDSWTQSHLNGIITEWFIANPFGGEMQISSIKFNPDETFFWNVAQADWQHSMEVWSNFPKERWSTFDLSDDGNMMTLHTRFEYVGIIKIATNDFKIHLDQDIQLVLENKDVQLKLLKQVGPY